MDTIKIDTTQYTEESILALAQEKGYQTQVAEVTETPVLDEFGNDTGEVTEETTFVDNPQTPEQYLGELVKNLVTDFFSARLIREAKEQARQAERDTVAGIKTGIANTITVE